VKNNTNIFRLICEPRRTNSCKEHHTQLIEYDVRMQQEEKRYTQLISELKQTRWLTQPGISVNNDQKKPATSTINNSSNEGQKVELEATRLTGEEILHGSGLTMDQVLLNRPVSLQTRNNDGGERTRTGHSLIFHCTPSQKDLNGSYPSLSVLSKEWCVQSDPFKREPGMYIYPLWVETSTDSRILSFAFSQTKHK
jgi:hypothetical protein